MLLSACSSACLDGAPSTSGRHGQALTQHALHFCSHAPSTAAFSAQVRHSTRRANRGQLQTLCAIKKKSEKNLVCSKTLTIKPEHKDQVVDMCKQASLAVTVSTTSPSMCGVHDQSAVHPMQWNSHLHACHGCWSLHGEIACCFSEMNAPCCVIKGCKMRIDGNNNH